MDRATADLRQKRTPEWSLFIEREQPLLFFLAEVFPNVIDDVQVFDRIQWIHRCPVVCSLLVCQLTALPKPVASARNRGNGIVDLLERGLHVRRQNRLMFNGNLE